MKYVNISGKATHGKDFTAQILKEMLEEKRKRVLILHYGDYLKYLCKQIFGWDGEKDDNGRTILQKVGTDLVRQNFPNLWVNVVSETILGLKGEYDVCLIPDARFKNECIVPKAKGLDVINVRINRNNYTSPLTEEQLNHPSETDLDNYLFDYYLEFETGRENVIKSIKESGLLDKL